MRRKLQTSYILQLSETFFIKYIKIYRLITGLLSVMFHLLCGNPWLCYAKLSPNYEVRTLAFWWFSPYYWQNYLLAISNSITGLLHSHHKVLKQIVNAETFKCILYIYHVILNMNMYSLPIIRLYEYIFIINWYLIETAGLY